MSARILITEPIVESIIDDLKKDYSVEVGKRGRFDTENELINVIGNYDAILSMLSNPISAEVIEAANDLKIIANHAVGYNNINLKAAKKAGIAVAHTPEVLTESTADFTIGLLISVARKIADAEQFLRNGKFNGWDPLGFLGTELSGKTLGIFGMGRIGTAVAQRAKGFGLSILYHNRSRIAAEAEQELDASYVINIEKLAERADVLSLHCPLNNETRHAVNKNILDKMDSNALLINTSRGSVVDEAALAEALHRGDIGGAALDVFENEPAVHSRLLSAPNCVITPHIASATHHTRTAIGKMAAAAIRSRLSGKNTSEISNLISS